MYALQLRYTITVKVLVNAVLSLRLFKGI